MKFRWCGVFGHRRRRTIVQQPERWTRVEAWVEIKTEINHSTIHTLGFATTSVTPVYHPAYEAGKAREAWTCKRRGCEAHGERTVTLRRDPQPVDPPVDTE